MLHAYQKLAKCPCYTHIQGYTLIRVTRVATLENTVLIKKTIFQVSKYAEICHNACKTLAKIFALSLGIPMDYFETPGFFDNPTCLLGMNNYHFPESKLWRNEKDPFGIKPHMDSGIFTLLLTDGSEGLERCINRKVQLTLRLGKSRKSRARRDFDCEIKSREILGARFARFFIV